MSGIHAPVRFFLGANTPGGFVGYIDDLYDAKDGWQAYIIKSGPGTGKSSLMRAVLDKLTDLGQEAEVICCSSDPNSLDGVLFPAMKMCILDGTAPHVIEPSYWGAVEQIIPLASCMDTALLHRQAPAVIAATDANKAMHARCRKFLARGLSDWGQHPHRRGMYRRSQSRPLCGPYRGPGIRSPVRDARTGKTAFSQRRHPRRADHLPRDPAGFVSPYLCGGG